MTLNVIGVLWQITTLLSCKRSQACVSCQSLQATPKPSKKKAKKADMYEMQPSPEEIYYLSCKIDHDIGTVHACRNICINLCVHRIILQILLPTQCHTNVL